MFIYYVAVLNGGTNNISGPELFHDTPILREDPLLAQDVVNVSEFICIDFLHILILILLLLYTADESHSTGQ